MPGWVYVKRVQVVNITRSVAADQLLVSAYKQMQKQFRSSAESMVFKDSVFFEAEIGISE